MHFNFKRIPLIASLIFAIQAADPITFLGGDQAESTISKTGTTLSVSKGTSGAQFPYAKNVKDPKAVSLATVSLVGSDGSSVALQDEFNVIAQACSCYWLDAKELSEKFPNLKSGTYYIVMKGSDFEVKSGTLRLETKIAAGNAVKEATTSSKDEDKNSKSSSKDDDDTKSTETGSTTKATKSSTGTKPTGSATKITDSETSEKVSETSKTDKKETKSTISKTMPFPSETPVSNANTIIPLTSALLFTLMSALVL